MSDSQALSRAIRQARKHLDKGLVRSEADVRSVIVSPVLRCLGWNPEDPLSVRREYSVGSGAKRYFFDYALFSQQGENVTLVIETKALGKLNEDARDQLLLYAMKKGTALGLLTDGNAWAFYLPLAEGSSKARLATEIEIGTVAAADAAAVLERYLERSNVLSGQAARNAAADRDRRIVGGLIEEGWAAVRNEEPERLAALIATRARQANQTSSLPVAAEVIDAAALRFVRGGFRWSEESDSMPVPERPRPPAQPDRPVPPRKKPSGKPGPRAAAWKYRGSRQIEKNPTELYVRVINALAEEHGVDGFCAELQERIRGRKRMNIARSPLDASSKRAYARPLPGGWYLNTNLSTAQKLKHLKAACEVAGISWGSDLVVEVKASKAPA